MRKLLRKFIFSVFGYKVTIEGSNDGENWEYIDTLRLRKNKKYELLPTKEKYSYYKLSGYDIPSWWTTLKIYGY